MGILKFASAATEKIELKGGDDWLEVRSDLSKGTFNQLLGAMPNREIAEGQGLTLSEGLTFAQALFEALVVGWSASEEANLQNYLALSSEAASEVDAALIEHFGKISPNKDQTSKVSTSRGKAQRATGPTA